MLNNFRIISLIEGLSFLVLLFVAMPLKYYWGYPEAVSMVGMTHGLLFVAYLLLASVVGQRQGWSVGPTFLVVLAGTLPFGCFMLAQ